MQFKRATLEGIARGDITLAFRRWKRPTVKAGTRLRTALGEVRIGRVEAFDEASLDDECARRAGFTSLSELKGSLRGSAERLLFRIELNGIGADRRVALRTASKISAHERQTIQGRFQRWDRAARHEGYHLHVLSLIAENPATAAAELAAKLNMEKLSFKRDVRKLKELGLTESLDVGYRLSPRGHSFLNENETS